MATNFSCSKRGLFYKFAPYLFTLILIVISLSYPLDKLIYVKLLPISNTSFGTVWAHVADYLGNGGILVGALFLGVLALRLCRIRPNWTMVMAIVLSVAASGLICQLLKFLVGRPRPGMELPPWDIILLSTANDYHSFPSGHAAAAFACATILAEYCPHCRWLWLILAFLVSMGRVVGQSHFLTDVVAGAVIGLGTSRFVLTYMVRFEPKVLVLLHAIQERFSDLTLGRNGKGPGRRHS